MGPQGGQGGRESAQTAYVSSSAARRNGLAMRVEDG